MAQERAEEGGKLTYKDGKYISEKWWDEDGRQIE